LEQAVQPQTDELGGTSDRDRARSRGKFKGQDIRGGAGETFKVVHRKCRSIYQLYLRGRFHWNKREDADIKRSIGYFNQTVALDPNNALAYTGLSDAYVTLYERDPSFSKEYAEKARVAAETALKIDDTLGEAHTSLGFILLLEYDFSGSEREFRRALELSPNYGLAHAWYSNLLRYTGRFEEAIAESRRAVDLEPVDPLINNSYGATLMLARRYDEAIAHLAKTIELDPTYAGPYLNIGLIHLYKGDYRQAVENFAKAQDADSRHEAADDMRDAFTTGGWAGFIRRGRERSGGAGSPYRLARNYLQLGDKEEAFRQLNRAFDVRDPQLIRLKVEPLFDGIRDDPRYDELVRKVGFPE